MAQFFEIKPNQFVEVTIEGKDRNDLTAPLFNVSVVSSNQEVISGGEITVVDGKFVIILDALSVGSSTITITSSDKEVDGQTFTEVIEATVTPELSVRMEVVIGEPQDR